MFRVVIVDDNRYERDGIIKSINWGKLDAEIVGAFSNGAKVLGKIDELNPHIIITDIAMPVMNGIQMSEHIRKSHPDISIIFISCHSDFQFARSAIDLGVYRYVLKPIISHELEIAVKELLDEYRLQDLQYREKQRMMKQMEEMLPMVQEQFLKELLLGNFHDNEDIRRRIDFLKIRTVEKSIIHVMLISVNEHEEMAHAVSVADSYFISYSIKNIVATFNNDMHAILPVQISNHEFAAVFFSRLDINEPDAVLNERRHVVDAAAEINMEVGRQLELNTTMGISRFSVEMADIPILYRQSCKAVETRFYSGSNPIILFEEIEDRSEGALEAIPSLESVYRDVKALLNYGEDKDDGEIRAFIEKNLNPRDFMPDENYAKSFISLAVTMASIILMESNQSFKDIFGDNILIWKKLNQFETIVDIKQWTFNIFKMIKEHLSEKSRTKSMRTIEMIKDIIKNRYSEQISIDEISKSVYLSPRYANSIFKKEMDKTIFDYLMEYRLEKAKKLLREPDGKVAAVAEAVGYVSTSYFCLAFKKNVGMTPAEYKNRSIL
jgi:two-component system, response regulator YesN